ncbi:MAG TPA: histidine--tRNA ligase [Actinomycetota bacterium]|nr:histidine--tRNA ligase [Actinomycetota bacterium]
MKQPRGTQDFLPPASERFWALEQLGADIFARAGYGRAITPMFEETDLFERGVGESTDIVNKEMYTFSDRSDNSLTLRPEGTASVMRAIVTHHLWDKGLPIKLYYDAAMFRYERPQKGRFRQHHQLGIEAVGSEDPALDAEVIELGHTLLREARAGDVTLLLNSMGHRGPNCRDRYLPALRAFLEQHRDELDADCKRRMVQNPLRVFDCKVQEDQAILANAPMLSDFICEDCRAHLASVEGFLDDAEIKYDIAPRLVRGFDYYTRTTFEYQSGALEAAQNAVGGGGRYDGLVEEVGGPPLPGIGFGLGIERILLAQEAAGGAAPAATLDCYVIPLEQAARPESVRLARRMREAGLAADVAYVERGLKTQLKHADRIGARFAGLIGEKERVAGQVTMRNMTSGEQTLVALDEATSWLAERAR